jgi:hypothetical protein
MNVRRWRGAIGIHFADALRVPPMPVVPGLAGQNTPSYQTALFFEEVSLNTAEGPVRLPFAA